MDTQPTAVSRTGDSNEPLSDAEVCRLQNEAAWDQAAAIAAIRTLEDLVDELKQQLENSQASHKQVYDHLTRLEDDAADVIAVWNDRLCDQQDLARAITVLTTTDRAVRAYLEAEEGALEAGTAIDQAMLLHGAEDRFVGSPWPQPEDDNGDYARGIRS